MPRVLTDDRTELYYEAEGSGETVVFVGEAGLGAWQWGWQHARVAGPYQTLVWDLPGTGRSECHAGDLTVDRLSKDMECVLSAADIPNCHLVGVGLGGMVAMGYAHSFNRADSLTLYNTAPSGTAVDTDTLRTLCLSDEDGSKGNPPLGVAFSAEYREANPELLDCISEWRGDEDADVAAVEQQVAAIEAFESGPLYELTLPVLVCHGQDDPVVDSSVGKSLAERLPRGRFVPVADKHLCFIEHSRAVTDRMLTFIEESGDRL